MTSNHLTKDHFALDLKPNDVNYGAMQQNSPSHPKMPIEVFAEAIRSCRMIQATYNGAAIELQPYQIFIRNGAVYLGAFNPSKNWRSDEDLKLGYFNISGITDLALTDTFEPSSHLNTGLPRDGDTLLLAIDRAT